MSSPTIIHEQVPQPQKVGHHLLQPFYFYFFELKSGHKGSPARKLCCTYMHDWSGTPKDHLTDQTCREFGLRTQSSGMTKAGTGMRSALSFPVLPRGHWHQASAAEQLGCLGKHRARPGYTGKLPCKTYMVLGHSRAVPYFLHCKR